jgi:hypothetical protein
VGTGNYSQWSEGPALPEARADAASVVVGSTLYLIGGFGPDGSPTATVYSLTVNNDGTLGEWVTHETALPAARAGASAASVSDGIVVMGGTDGSAPTKDVWKTVLDADGAPGDWVAQQPQPWRASAETNLPFARTDMSGFTTNGVIYVQGGSDGSEPKAETLWTTPDAGGVIPDWHNLAQTDLGTPLEGAAGVVSGSHAFVMGGTTPSGPTAGVARANLAPQEPFFQLGILGAVVPALQLQGEIGQQIGYLNAATVGAVNFILLIVVAWGFNHQERVRELVAAVRNRRRGKGG